MMVFIWCAVTALIIGGLYYGYKAEQKRKQECEELARSLGMQFYPEQGAVSFPSTRLFTLGRSRKIKNILKGPYSGVEALLFDYFYTTGSGKSRKTHFQTVAAFRSERKTIPPFVLRPEGFFDSIAGFFGVQDIDLARYPTFSKMYVLQAANEGTAQLLFSPTTISFFEKSPGWCIESDGTSVVIYKTRVRKPTDQLRSYIDESRKIAGLFGM